MNKMRRFKVDKLVRDKITEISSNDGVTNFIRELQHEEYLSRLNAKLIEEAHEVVNTKDNSELAEELADLLEVLHAIAVTNNIELEEIEGIRLKKKQERGGFENKIYIDYIEIPDDHQRVSYYLLKAKEYPEIK